MLHGHTVVQRVATDVHAELLRFVLHQVGDVGAMEQRFAGNAADVDADPAELVPLHHRRIEAELRGADRADVATRSAAYDYYVEGRHLSQVLGKRLGDQRGAGSSSRRRGVLLPPPLVTTPSPADSPASVSPSAAIWPRLLRR